MLVAMVHVFLKPVHINCWGYQKDIMKFEWLELITYITIQNYVKSFSGDCWQSYITEMTQPQTWCDNLIIQAVSNSLHCVIYITDSVNNSPAKVITPSFVTPDRERTVIFLGYISGLHYVSAIQKEHNVTIKKNTHVQNLKRKLLESNDTRQIRLSRNRQNKKVKKLTETQQAKAARLAKQREYKRAKISAETSEAKSKRLEKRREQYKLRKMKKDKQNIHSNELSNNDQPTANTIENLDIDDCQENNDSFPPSTNTELHEMQSRYNNKPHKYRKSANE